MTKIEKIYLFLIVLIYAAACVETDIYLPAFTDMMGYFQVSEDQIQKLLSWNFIGICLSGPFYGPIADAYGRKKPLIFALGFFLLGSVMTMFAHSFEWMLIGRLLQGVGSGGCFTLGTAIIFDAFQKDRAMKAVNMLNLLIPFLMATAPLIGGWLNVQFGFRSNFTFIGALVGVSLAICWAMLKEPLTVENRIPLKGKTLARDFKRALTNGPFWIMTGIISLIFAGYIAFLSTSSVLFVKEFGVSKKLFPIFQAAILIAWLAASLVFHFRAQQIGAQRIKRWGVGLLFSAGIAMTLAAFFTPRDPILLTLAMVPFSFGANWVLAMYFPEGMEALPDIKGLTSSLLTSVRLLITAVVVGATSVLYNETIYPVAIVEIATVAICVPILIAYERSKTSVKESA